MALYKSPPATFEELTDPLPAEIQEIASLLRKNVRSVLPEADEQVSGGEKWDWLFIPFIIQAC